VSAASTQAGEVHLAGQMGFLVGGDEPVKKHSPRAFLPAIFLFDHCRRLLAFSLSFS